MGNAKSPWSSFGDWRFLLRTVQYFSVRGAKMKKIIIFGIVILVMGIISFSSHPVIGPTEAFGQSPRKVLMIPREGYSVDLDLMIKMEVGVMTWHLKRAGFEVDIATTSGFPIVGPTQKIGKVMRLADINLDNYAGIIMPCMAVGAFPGPPVSQEAIVLVKKALADGKPVAAPFGSVIILAEAGVLKGKKYAFFRDPLKTDKDWKLTDLRFVDAIYSGTGVVQEGKIITSGACPTIEMAWGGENKTVELTKTFIAAIGPK
jgi:putative intracellular protease/amidase